jgi:HSP20 family protein
MSNQNRYENSHLTLTDVLDELFSVNAFESVNRNISGVSWPRVDITENGNEYILRADLPGIDKNDINIVIENGTLRIEGEKKAEHKKENDKYYHVERSYGKFSRSFGLPEEIDAERVDAKMVNGVLELTLPKNEKAKPKQLQVKVQ